LINLQSIFIWPSGSCSDFDLVERVLNRLHSQNKIRKIFVANRFSVARYAERWAKQTGVDFKKYSSENKEEIDRVFSNGIDLVSLAFSEESPNEFSKKVCNKYGKDFFIYARLGPSFYGKKL